MQPLKAHVKNGQVVLDEPTDLPNGTELYVVPAEQLDDVVLLRDDGLDENERKRLHEAIRAGIKDGEAGRVSDFDEFIDGREGVACRCDLGRVATARTEAVAVDGARERRRLRRADS